MHRFVTERTDSSVQPKLRVGRPDDKYEREADRVGRAVVRGSDSTVERPTEGRAVPRVQRLCPECWARRRRGLSSECPECEEPVQRVTRSSNPSSSPPQSSPSGESPAPARVDNQVRAARGGGQPLPETTRSFFEPRFGTDFSDVRVHTDGRAARSARALDARAYAVGRDVVFAAGEYAPSTDRGRRLLAHELVHVVQQTGPGNAERVARQQSAPEPSQESSKGDSAADSERTENRVERVVLSCEDDRIVFATAEANYAYKLGTCDLTEGTYEAQVTVSGDSVHFSLGTVPKGTVFEFDYLVEPEQTNPARLFGEQRRVTVVATKLPLASHRLSVDESGESRNLASRVAAFKRLVRNAAIVRLDNNREALEEWKSYLQTKLTPEQVESRVGAIEVHDMLMLAEHADARGRTAAEQWMRTPGPNTRWVLKQFAEGDYEACTGCHALVAADAMDYELMLEYGRQLSPAEKMSRAAERSQSGPPAAVPEFTGEEVQPGGLPDWTNVPEDVFPTMRQTATDLAAVGPYQHLRKLGPKGYDVLPEEVLGHPGSSAELLATVVGHIEQRQRDYKALAKLIGDPDFDYTKLRPLVRELLPVADGDVRRVIEAELAAAKDWETVKSIVVGLATLGSLLLIVFPPTTLGGVAAAGALGATLAVEQAYSGIQSYQQGRMYALSRGTEGVFDPEQQAAAGTLMAMGILNATLGALDVAGTLRGVKIVRTGGTGVEGAEGAASIVAVEGRAGDETVRITGLDTPDPHVRVTGADGTVVREGPVSAVLGGKAPDAPTPGRSGDVPGTGPTAGRGGGTPDADVPGTVVGTQRLDLPGGGSHSVVVSRVDGGTQLWLCSHCGRLLTRIDEALAASSATGPTKSLHARLGRLRQRVAEVERGLQRGAVTVDDLPAELNQIGAHLRDLSHKYGDVDVLKPFRELPISPEMREFIRETAGGAKRHFPASGYSRARHVRGKTNAQRKANSVNGNGQYLAELPDGTRVTDELIEQWEREGLQLAREGRGRVESGGGGSYKCYVDLKRPVGYANGKETSVVRVEWTAGGEVHSHPRPPSDL